MLKRIICLGLCFFVLSSICSSAVNYDAEGAFWECYTLYPDFINKVKREGASNRMIIAFLNSVKDYLISLPEELTEENFDENMYSGIRYASNLTVHMNVRNALAAAFPQSLPDALEGVVTEAFMPIYETVKRFIFGIESPVITLSVTYEADGIAVYAHSAHLPEDARFVLALYDDEGSLTHVKAVTPNTESDPVRCTSGDCRSAKLFAWEKDSLTPICDTATALIGN